MSGKPTKRPAHEVILEDLGTQVTILRKDVGDDLVFHASILTAIKTLCHVAQEMIIPEGEREKVLQKLQQLANEWKEHTDSYNQIAALHRKLLSEE